jgi:NTE family protein
MQVALFLQGGGALGAYQAGVYAALAKASIDVDWVSGISIGAFNAAIIAGNKPEDRVEKLRGFWQRIATDHPTPALTTLLGVDGFFSPAGTGFPHSIYDITPMKKTLKDFVDFDYLNDRSPTRLSIAAADAQDPKLVVYFDSRKGADAVPPDHAIDKDSLLQITEKHRITPEHILASGALSPAFPTVKINGHHYVDAGLTPGANSPVAWAAKTGQLDRNTMAICADLWRAPTEGQIKHSQHYSEQEQEKDRQFASPPLAQSDVGALISLVLKRREDQDYTKDYDFSTKAISANWNAGFADMMGALETHLDTKALVNIIQKQPVEGRSYLSKALQRTSSGAEDGRTL